MQGRHTPAEACSGVRGSTAMTGASAEPARSRRTPRFGNGDGATEEREALKRLARQYLSTSMRTLTS
jgi:hypothetical protein